MKAIERRLQSIEAAVGPSGKKFTIKNFRDLVIWGWMAEDVRPDLSDASEDFLRPLYEALRKDEEGQNGSRQQ